MTATTISQLTNFGPQRCDPHTAEQARVMCRNLALGHAENFSVLSIVVPPELRDDFSALYAFCRWADDLGDEISDRQRSLDLLAWWRSELELCYAGTPRHPVLTALAPVIHRHDLPMSLFDDLIRAFEQDQTRDRYDTWQQLLDDCRLSANPVGRLVLMICGEQRNEHMHSASDHICTALQLTNHWQDVKRDALDRNRIYIPREVIDEANIPDFEQRLLASAQHAHGVDQSFLTQYRRALKLCVDRTWPIYDAGSTLFDMVSPRTAPLIWLLAAGGQHTLRLIELWNYETALHRPSLGKFSKIMLIIKAWWMTRRAMRVTSRLEIPR